MTPVFKAFMLCLIGNYLAYSLVFFDLFWLTHIGPGARAVFLLTFILSLFASFLFVLVGTVIESQITSKRND